MTARFNFGLTSPRLPGPDICPRRRHIQYAFCHVDCWAFPLFLSLQVNPQLHISSNGETEEQNHKSLRLGREHQVHVLINLRSTLVNPMPCPVLSTEHDRITSLLVSSVSVRCSLANSYRTSYSTAPTHPPLLVPPALGTAPPP